jgi:hypothetical protein
MIVASALAVGGCSPSGLPALSSGEPPPPGETGSLPPAAAAGQVNLVVSGTAPDVYALVAGGALKCWFGPNGALKASHMFRAEAASPADGGKAQIVIHERDAAAREGRGAQAFQVGFENAASGAVRVEVVSTRMDAAAAPLMVKDVEVWGGGGKGCQMAVLAPSPAAKPATAGKAAPKKR